MFTRNLNSICRNCIGKNTPLNSYKKRLFSTKPEPDKTNDLIKFIFPGSVIVGGSLGFGYGVNCLVPIFLKVGS